MECNKDVLIKFRFSEKAMKIDVELSEERVGPCLESKEIPRKSIL